MDGQALYNLMTSILNQSINQITALSYLNLARTDIEGKHPWAVLKALDATQTVGSGNSTSTPFSVPTSATPSLLTPSFMRYIKGGTIVLTNTLTPTQKVYLREIPFESQLDYIGQNYFYANYATGKFYMMPMIQSTYLVNQFFIADYGDIQIQGIAGAAKSTTWVGFPPRFSPALAFQACARWRLGNNYDDVAARNADENFKSSEAIVSAMVMWNAEIITQQTEHLDPAGFTGEAFGRSDDGLFNNGGQTTGW